MRIKVEVRAELLPLGLSALCLVCRRSVESLYGKEIVQHHVSQQQLSVSVGGTVGVPVRPSKEEAPESSQPGGAGQLGLGCQ